MYIYINLRKHETECVVNWSVAPFQYCFLDNVKYMSTAEVSKTGLLYISSYRLYTCLIVQIAAHAQCSMPKSTNISHSPV